MQAKFRREDPYSKPRFRGLAVWHRGDVKQTICCDQSRGTSAEALDDARQLVAELSTVDWFIAQQA